MQYKEKSRFPGFFPSFQVNNFANGLETTLFAVERDFKLMPYPGKKNALA